MFNNFKIRFILLQSFPLNIFGKQSPQFKLPNPLKSNNIQDLINNIAEFAVGLGVAIASLLIIYAAFQILTAGGNPEQFNKGKRTILYTVVGLVILFLSYAIINTIKEILGVK